MYTIFLVVMCCILIPPAVMAGFVLAVLVYAMVVGK